MKTEIKEIRTSKLIFVSKDGKEFDTEADCKAWEKSYEGTLEYSIRAINQIRIDGCELGVPCTCYDDYVFAIKPRNLDEIILINAWIDCKTGSNGDELTVEDIGQIIILNFGYDYEYCTKYNAEKMFQQQRDDFSKVLAKLNEGEENKDDKQ